MFFRRLYLMLAIVILLAGVVLARLVQIQVFDAAQYNTQAEDQLVRPLRIIPPIRGSILARHGQLLVSNEPAWQVCVDYPALAATLDSDWVKRQARMLLKDSQAPGRLSGTDKSSREEGMSAQSSRHGTLTPAEARQRVLDQISALFRKISVLTHTPLPQLLDTRDRIVERVTQIKQQVSAAKRRPMKLELERIAHPLVTDLSREEALRLRSELHGEPWCKIEATEKRTYHQATTAFAHLLGRTGQVSPQMLENDPHSDDRRLQYRPDERVGISGVERLADARLRGLAGYVLETRDQGVLDDVRPDDGENVRLTIDERLQTVIYRDFGQYVKSLPYAVGGAVVVLDVPSRELLAVVSYPSYDPGQFTTDYDRLKNDLKHQPLLHRAVQGQYAPGSILKPVVLASALSAGVITPGTPFNCRGYLYDPTAFRCWIWKFQTGHGTLDAEEALKYSCNVYMFNVGMAMGTPRLTDWFDRFGLGHPTGVGLLDETSGVNPTPEWLQRVRHRAVAAADCRNYAIGQGEVTVSPLQAANMIAEATTGESRPPTLLAGDVRPRPVKSLGLSSAAIQTVRKGMYRVVNDAAGQRGTAYNFARMDELDVGGKTGTAQASRLRLGKGRYYPPLEASKHAWFAGFAPAGGHEAPKIVVCVFVEYGGGGGQTAGPMAKAVFGRLIHLGYLSVKLGHTPQAPESYLPAAPLPTSTEPVYSPGALQPVADETQNEPAGKPLEEE